MYKKVETFRIRKLKSKEKRRMQMLLNSCQINNISLRSSSLGYLGDFETLIFGFLELKNLGFEVLRIFLQKFQIITMLMNQKRI